MRRCLTGHIQIFFFLTQKIQSISMAFEIEVSRKLKTMEMKQSQTFSQGTYSNLTSYLLSKNIEVFQ